jgi:hypothetical protein
MDSYTPPKSETASSPRDTRPVLGFLVGLFVIVLCGLGLQILILSWAFTKNPLSEIDESMNLGVIIGGVVKWVMAFLGGYLCMRISRSRSLYIVFILSVVSVSVSLLAIYVSFNSQYVQGELVKEAYLWSIAWQVVPMLLIIVGGKLALR